VVETSCCVNASRKGAGVVQAAVLWQLGSFTV